MLDHFPRSIKDHVPRRSCIEAAGLILAICLAVAPATPSRAEGPVRTITLDEAKKIALENNRDIQKAYEYKKKVLGFYIEQRSYALPQLTAQATAGRSWDDALSRAQSKTIETAEINVGPFVLPRSRISIAVPPDGEEKNVGVTLTQPLFTWGQVGAAIKGAKFGLATADDEIRLYRQGALRDVTTTFYDVLLLKEIRFIASENLKQKTAHLDQARRRFAAGVATEYDVLAAEVGVKNARPEVIRTEFQIKSDLERLRFLLGIAEPVDIVGELGMPGDTAPVLDESLNTAYRRRPELAEMRNRLGMTEQLVKVYNAGDRPRVDFRATGGYREVSIGPEDFDGKTWSLGLAVTFPFFDGFRTRGKVAQARSDVSTLRIEEAKLVDSVGLQIRDSVNAVNDSANIVQAITGNVAQAQELLMMAEKGYEYGVKTRLDVDDAALNLVVARGSLAKAKRDHQTACVLLIWAMGILGEEESSHP